MRFAIHEGARVVAVCEAQGWPDMPGHVQEIPDGVAVEPGEHEKDGAGGWRLRVKSDAEVAAAALAAIDQQTGMSRAMREALIAIAGPGKAGFLEAKEAEAATHRAKL